MFICPGSTTIYAEPVADQFISVTIQFHGVLLTFIKYTASFTLFSGATCIV